MRGWAAVGAVAISVHAWAGLDGFHATDLTPVSGETREPGEVVLVENGKPRIPVYASDNPGRFAAKFLNDILFAKSGTRLETRVVKPEELTGAGPGIWIKVKQERSDGSFSIAIRGDTVIVSGDAPYGLVDLEERLLGVRRYMPAGTDALCIPGGKADRVALPRISWADRPVFDRREIFPASVQLEGPFWKMADNHGPQLGCHAPVAWNTETNFNYRETLPEIFQMTSAGTRGESPMLCYGNPRTLEEYKRRIRLEVEGRCKSGGICDIRRKTVTVCQWDGNIDCHCAHCRRLADPSAGPSGSGSPIIWGYFVRELSKWVKSELPGWTIMILPYLNTCDVPKGLVFPAGNVEAMLCTMPGLALLKNPACRAREEALIRSWAKATGRKVQNWHYLCWPADFTCAPYVFGETISAHYRTMRDVLSGSFVDGGVTPRLSLSSYVWARVMWNPDVDVHAIYDGFARNMFGPAAKPMRELVRMQEAGWNREWKTDQISNRNIYGISYPRAEVERMTALLEEARRLAADDPTSLKHVEWYAAPFKQFFRESGEYAAGGAFEPLKMQKASECPKVDGVLDDAAWTTAVPLRMVDAKCKTNSAPDCVTEVRAVWVPEKGVTFGIRCAEPKVDRMRLSSPAFEYGPGNEKIEFFLDVTGGGDGAYQQVVFDTAGTGAVLCTSDAGSWKGAGVKGAWKAGKDFWSMELFVPFAAVSDIKGVQLPTTAALGRVWNGNIARQRVVDYDKEGLWWRSWSRLYTRYGLWNKDSAAFGTFQFVE